MSHLGEKKMREKGIACMAYLNNFIKCFDIQNVRDAASTNSLDLMLAFET